MHVVDWRCKSGAACHVKIYAMTDGRFVQVDQNEPDRDDAIVARAREVLKEMN